MHRFVKDNLSFLVLFRQSERQKSLFGRFIYFPSQWITSKFSADQQDTKHSEKISMCTENLSKEEQVHNSVHNMFVHTSCYDQLFSKSHNPGRS